MTIGTERLNELLSYSADSGVFTWKVKVNSRAKAGDTAGTVCHGYIRIGIDGKLYAAHRLAVFIMTGKWPEAEVDHRDGNSLNNAYKNLRCCAHKDNLKNQKLSKANSSGFKGVHYCKSKKKWLARLRKSGLMSTVGRFDDPVKAAIAYDEAAKVEYGRFARTNRDMGLL